MTRHKVLAGFAIVTIASALSATAAVAADLTVTVTYTGKGKVDEAHEILVFLFNDPNITAQSVPLTVSRLRRAAARQSSKISRPKPSMSCSFTTRRETMTDAPAHRRRERPSVCMAAARMASRPR
jgi:hypothetical protein